jgi:flagellar biosynthetic protein FliR
VIFARVTGIFIFNPILGRSTVPMQVRVAMSIVLTFVFVGAIGDTVGFVPQSMMHFGLVLVMEAVLGFFFGFVVNLFLNAIIYAGKVMDFQISFALAEALDPSTGITMPIMGSLYYYMFVLYFFLAGGHLNFIRIFVYSYDIIPIGFEFTSDWRTVALVIAAFFSEILILAVKMAMPLIASQLILQIAVGVIMKAVPAIQIFVLNLQLRVIMGLFLIMAITPVMSDFLQDLLGFMFESLHEVMQGLGSSYE